VGCNCPDSGFPFAYTIGNAIVGLPELLVIGTHEGNILNILSERMIARGRAFDDGEIVSLGGKYPIKIVNADQRAQSEYTIQAGQHHGYENYTVQQVLLCDRQGCFPGDPGCWQPFSLVPILKPH